MVQKLSGHTNVVYAISFNLPYGDKVATGSFDTTAKLWSVDTGKYQRIEGIQWRLCVLLLTL